MDNKNIWFMVVFRFPIIYTENCEISILWAIILLDFALVKQRYKEFGIVTNSE